jgi:hypothetical protein
VCYYAYACHRPAARRVCMSCYSSQQHGAVETEAQQRSRAPRGNHQTRAPSPKVTEASSAAAKRFFSCWRRGCVQSIWHGMRCRAERRDETTPQPELDSPDSWGLVCHRLKRLLVLLHLLLLLLIFPACHARPESTGTVGTVGGTPVPCPPSSSHCRMQGPVQSLHAVQ